MTQPIKFRKLLYAITLFLIFLICTTLFACKDTTAISLYDGDRYIKKVSAEIDEEYNFGRAEKTGYTFLGWYSEIEGGTAFTDAQGKSAGMTWKESNPSTLYAHWQANKYKISLEYCGATAFNTVTEISATYDLEITDKLPVPKKTGASFLGWYTAEENGNQITDAKGSFLENTLVYNNAIYPMNGEGTTLYARWGAKTVTYLFSTDGTTVSEATYPVGTTLYELPSSEKDNHCFVSWCFDSTLMTELKLPYTISESSEEFVTLYAKFEQGTIDVLQFSTVANTGDKEYEVTYSGNAEKLVVPDSYYGKKVTRVKRISSFTVKEIILPQTVTSFADGAFENCSALEKVNIPYAVTEISDRCFAGCNSLEEMVIPQNATTIGEEAFSGCAQIPQINVPASVTKIDTGAFRNMNSLTKFIVDETNGRYAAKDDVLYYKVGNSLRLIQYPASKQGATYTIDSSTTEILEYAFSSAKITSISIGGKITVIKQGAFENCKNLVNVSIAGEATSFTIGVDAFLNCSNLKAMKIELSRVPVLNETSLNGVSETFSVYVTSDMIKKYQNASNWKKLSSNIYSLGTIFGDFAVAEVDGGYAIRQYFGAEKEVVIPEILNAHNIVGISENAFSHSNVEKVTISKNIRTIDSGAFQNCTAFNTLIMECAPPTLGNDVFKNVGEDFTIYIKSTLAVLEAYKTADKWKDYSDNIWSFQ